MELGQETRFPAEFRRQPALRTSHHEPGVQRSALSHPGAQAAGARFHAARVARIAGADRGAGRSPAGGRGRTRRDRSDRRFCRRHSDPAHRRHARHSARRARAVARLVARHPRRARAGAQPRAIRYRRPRGRGVQGLSDDIIARRRERRQRSGGNPVEAHRRHRPVSRPTRTGERLSKLELIHNCIFLLNAGHETTTNLIGNAVDLLIRHPDVDERSAPPSAGHRNGGRRISAHGELEPAR